MAPLLAHKPGVDRAFERLYRHHALEIYRYAYAVLRNQADAEDVTQTTFMNAYRALERGETPETPHNWLIAIAHNVCRQRFRQAARRVQEVNLEDDVADHFVAPEDDDAPSPEDIKRALNHLAFNQRAALVMRELEGRSYAEIADLLDLSVGAVETLIFRARRALREQLEGSLTCGQAEQFLSRQLDGRLTKPERGQLRAHLRECAACRRLARSQRAQRSAFRALGAIPLPQSLASLFGGGAAAGSAVAVKVAAVVVTSAVVGGVGYDVHHQIGRARAPKQPAHHAAQVEQATPAGHTVSPPRVPIAAAAVAAPKGHRPARPQTARTPVEPVTRATPAQPAQPTVSPARPALPATPTAAGRRHGHGRPADAGKPAVPDAGPPPGRAKADDAGAPASPGRGQGSGGNGNGKGNADGAGRQPQPQPQSPQDPQNPQPIVTVPATTLPVQPPTAGDLTQTSQKDGARNDPTRHLHP